MTFLTMISKRICYRTIEWIPNRSTTSLLNAFTNVFCIYNCAGLTIWSLHCDPEFCHLGDALTDIDIDLQLCATQEHVPEVECSI